MRLTETVDDPVTDPVIDPVTDPVTDIASPDLVRVFIDLLTRHPDALVAAVGDDGILVPMPASVPIENHRVAVGRSVLDMVVPADKVAIITTWERSRQIGGASVMAHLLTDPDQPVLVSVVDARREHGVHLAMLVATTDSETRSGNSSMSAVVAPRTARIRKNELAIITEIDHATTQILGWEAEQIVGRRSLELIHPEDQERSISNWMEMLTAPGHDQRVRLRHLAADGSWVWMEITNRNLLNDDDHRCVMAEMLDISEELAAQEALRASEQRLRRLAESLPLGVVQIEADRHISYGNERLVSITGTPLSDSVTDQFQHVTPSDRVAFSRALDAVLDGGNDQDMHIRFERPETVRHGAVRHCTLSMRSLTNDIGAVTGAIVCLSDVSDQVRLTAELERRATFDALTGCLNRQSVMTFLDDRLKDPSEGVAIVFVDLDGFKDVNDGLGHAAGDALLAGVGAMLREAVREGDIVGRVGGDEFLVVCGSVGNLDEAFGVAARIDAVLERGILVGDETWLLTASLGVAQTSDPTATSDRLVAEADTRMYVEKRDRKQRSGSITTDRPSTLRTRASEESVALRRAIETGELEVHFQPIVSLPTTDLFGLEALVRWRRAGEVIPAIAFIGLAERSGLITLLGESVLEDTVRTAAETPTSDTDVRWFINMSPLELAARSKVTEVRDALDRHHLDPHRVVIEVTEHSDLSQSSDALRAIEALADLGIEIALDDFGTGYSSLALLRSMPVSYLKFDRSFTADLGLDSVTEHLLETCRDLASRLGISLIAEGVETEQQQTRLQQLGIELAQGYLFSVPRPIAELKALLSQR
ncbi:MAG: domain S-box-containing protein/diguanylate cyclase protein [Ilumatobacteraceae bacterium]|nr:domain S-box-containing protein/diguanylate cyclase protein [Ilumatobacteraceae bacterium]